MSSRAKRPDRAHHDWVSLAVPMGAAHLLVPGLQPHTQYQFSVLAQNKLGSGPFSKIVLSVPEGERPLNLEQQTRMGKSWQGKPGYGRTWVGRGRGDGQLGAWRGLWRMIQTCLGALEKGLGIGGCGRPGDMGKGTGDPISAVPVCHFRASYHTSCPQTSPDRDAAASVLSPRSGGS